MGCYPMATFPSYSRCNGVSFVFGQGQSGDSVRDGLIKSIIFSISSTNQSSGTNVSNSNIPPPIQH